MISSALSLVQIPLHILVEFRIGLTKYVERFVLVVADSGFAIGCDDKTVRKVVFGIHRYVDAVV
jgi:hypothetical protein